MMDAHGGRKPIWMTEFSYYGADNLPRHPFVPRANNWSEERLLDSRAPMRRLHGTVLPGDALARSREGVHPFRRQRPSERPQLRMCPVRLWERSAKLFAALAVMTDLLGQRPVFVGESQLGDLGHAAAFETLKQSLVALWSERDELGSRVVIPDGENRIVLDVVGRRMTGGSVDLSGSPAYLLGSPGQAKELLESLKLE